MKRQRAGLVVILAVLGLFHAGTAWAEGETEHPAEGEHHEAAPAPAEGEHHEAAPAPAEGEHHEAAPAEGEHHVAAPDGEHQDAEHHEGEHHDAEHHEAEHHDDAEVEHGDHHEAAGADSGGDADEEDHTALFDPDGDGKEDPELKKEYEDAFKGIPAEIDTAAVDKELDARAEDAELKPSMTVEQFRAVVRVVKKVVLTRMENKMEKSSAKKMAQFSMFIFFFSLGGLLLLALPLVMAKKYPGKMGVMFKYSALAAVTFFVTVNLFGGVLMGMRTVQGSLGSLTNPSLAIAAGTFDTLDRNAEDYITMGKELFAPTLEQLRNNSDEQPSVALIENGQKIVKDAKVFVSVAKMFKKVDFIFKILPIILFLVTMILFGLAIRPTLTEIIKLPMRAAAGEVGVGRETTKRAMRRVWGELLATICTIGVLTVLTLLSAFVLGQIVGPALDALLNYFSLAVSYLQFVEGASSGTVFLTLFGVILFLVFNLATLILSMSFFLGKSQKIFQQKFNDGVPIATHARFFKWGALSVVWVQLFPLLFAIVAGKLLLEINDRIMSGVTDADAVPWGKLMLAGPLFLVVGFALLFWAVRGFKAIRFLQAYKVKPTPPSAPSTPAEAV
jgi:hypothetical protein